MTPIRLNAPPPSKDRPRCPNCGRALPLWWVAVKSERVTRPGGGFEYQETLEWRGEYRGYGAFDRLRCTEEFANLAYKAGYRRKK